LYAWWLAAVQSTGYLYRFNQATLARMRAMRQNMTIQRIVPDEPWARALLIDKPYFPRGVVSAHVRHGDKDREMPLQPWSKYMNATEALVRSLPNSLNRIIFVSTEDDAVINESVGSGQEAGWTTMYSLLPRSNDHEPPATVINRLAPGREASITRLHFTQLLMALEADAWVGTRGSNWNRLIDELRCVWVPKCQLPFTEVGTDFKDYHWR
jgi:hypothetical protein